MCERTEVRESRQHEESTSSRTGLLAPLAAAIVPGLLAGVLGFGALGATAVTAFTAGCIGLAAALLRNR